MAEAEEKMEELTSLYARMKQEYQSVLHFFGEDSSRMSIDEFFGAFAGFIADFEVCKNYIELHPYSA